MHETVRRFSSYAPLTEEQKKNPLELFSKYHINDEVHRAVDRHKQIGRFHQSIVDLIKESLHDVDEDGEDIAADEHDDDTEKHCREADFSLLCPTQSLSLTVRLPHLSIDHRVEERDAQERDEVDENQIKPVNVDVDVPQVGSHVRCADAVHETELIVRILAQSDLEEARDVVADGEDDDDDDENARTSICADGSRPQRMANRNVSLECNRQREVNTGRLGGHRERIHNARYLRQQPQVVVAKVTGVRINGWHAE